MQENVWRICSPRLDRELRILFFSDLHGAPCPRGIEMIRELRPDFAVFTGDTLQQTVKSGEATFAFMEEAAALCPLFFSPGNHENYVEDFPARRLSDAGVTILDNAETEICGLRIGGLGSFYYREETEASARAFAKDFSREDGKFRLLLCHHPEYYPAFLRDLPIDLILSGHAHGGLIRLFGQGLVAPGQGNFLGKWGLFPKYTGGLYDGRLLISRGMSDRAYLPRVNNPTEIIILELGPQK